MKEDSDILNKIGRKSGMTTPDGYFDNFVAQMTQALPEKETNIESVAPKSTWQKIRPYVYMAAMFGGVWCMIKMFTMMTPETQPLSFENNQTLAEAVSDETFVDDYYMDGVNEYDLMEDMYEDGFDIASLY
ncbi:MAG: hypothetical protein IJC40_06045 [Muribaculaceae bacterium]|nr:hypothetical protein [Muribaculaceae bacterium]